MHRTFTIQEPAESEDLSTLEAVKVAVRVAQDDTSKDELLIGHLATASELVADYCRRHFGRATVRETFIFGPNDKPVESLVLRMSPIDTVTSVLEGTSETSLVEDTDFFLDGDGVLAPSMLTRGTTTGAKCWGCSRVIVDYIGGFALLDGLPYTLEQACLRTVSSLYHSRGADPNVRSIQVPDVETVTYGAAAGGDSAALGALLPDVQLMLKPFRRLF